MGFGVRTEFGDCALPIGAKRRSLLLSSCLCFVDVPHFDGAFGLSILPRSESVPNALPRRVNLCGFFHAARFFVGQVYYNRA